MSQNSTGKIVAVVVVGVVLFVGAIVALFKDKIFVKREAPTEVALPESAKLPPIATLNEDQRKAMEEAAKKVCAAVNEGKPADTAKYFDYGILVERVLSGFSLPANERKATIREMRSKLEGKDSVFSQFGGAKARFNRLRDINGQGGAVIRIMTAEGAMVFLYLMPEFRGVSVRFVDLYSVVNGSFVTENMRDVMIPSIKALTGGVSRDEQRKFAQAMEDLQKAKALGDPEAVMEATEKLPPELRTRATVRLVYLESLMSSGNDDAYQAELERIQKEEPDSAGTRFRLMDLHIIKKDWQKAAEAALQADETIGGDALLKASAGMCLSRAGKLEEAARLFEEAAAAEPDEGMIVTYRLHYEIAKGDFQALVKSLDQMKNEFHLEPTPEALVPDFPEFQKFIDSQEYKEWKARQ